jgi:hypothetical protein
LELERTGYEWVDQALASLGQEPAEVL